MFATEYKTSASSRRNSLSSLSSRRGLETSLNSDVDELVLQECIEIIDMDVEENVTNKANAREKKWWIDGNYKIIDENRLPLILVEDVSYEEFEKKCERANASKFWEYRDRTVVIIELPKHQVSNIGSTTCSATPGRIARGSSKQSNASFVPKLLPKPAQNPCDAEGNPWSNIIVEVANSQSLSSIIQKTTQFWLAPNRVEDVIILKLSKWDSRRDLNGTPLRRLTCYKFCRRRSPRNAHGYYLPIQAIEFGTIDATNEPYNGCIAAGMRILNISPRCIYRGCSRQPFANNYAQDSYTPSIQKIHANMLYYALHKYTAYTAWTEQSFCSNQPNGSKSYI